MKKFFLLSMISMSLFLYAEETHSAKNTESEGHSEILTTKSDSELPEKEPSKKGSTLDSVDQKKMSRVKYLNQILYLL